MTLFCQDSVLEITRYINFLLDSSQPYQGAWEQRRRRQSERQKRNRFNKQNNNFACASRFFVHFCCCWPSRFVKVSEKCVKFQKGHGEWKFRGHSFLWIFTLLEKDIIHWKQQLVVDCLRHSRSCENRKSVFHKKNKNQERRPFIAAVKGDWSIVIKHWPPRDLKKLIGYLSLGHNLLPISRL